MSDFIGHTPHTHMYTRVQTKFIGGPFRELVVNKVISVCLETVKKGVYEGFVKHLKYIDPSMTPSLSSFIYK